MEQGATRAQLQASAQQLREERADRAGKEQDAADAIALRDEAIQELKDMLKDEKVRCGTTIHGSLGHIPDPVARDRLERVQYGPFFDQYSDPGTCCISRCSQLVDPDLLFFPLLGGSPLACSRRAKMQLPQSHARDILLVKNIPIHWHLTGQHLLFPESESLCSGREFRPGHQCHHNGLEC